VISSYIANEHDGQFNQYMFGVIHQEYLLE